MFLIKIFDPDKSIPSPIIFSNSESTISPDEKSLSIPSEDVLDIEVELKLKLEFTKFILSSALEPIKFEFKISIFEL